MNASNLIVAGLAFSMSVSAFAAGTHGGGHGMVLPLANREKPQKPAGP